MKHVCGVVMGVLHDHGLGARQGVGDTVLVFVTDGLQGGRQRNGGRWLEKKDKDMRKISTQERERERERERETRVSLCSF